jgi:hypothetical protein
MSVEPQFAYFLANGCPTGLDISPLTVTRASPVARHEISRRDDTMTETNSEVA